jgi:hypothetical protein
MISGRLTMRAQIERETATGSDAWGGPNAGTFAPLGDPVACFVYSQQASQLVDGQKQAQIEVTRALFALGTDVRPGDRLASVTDRKGVVLHAGPLKVEGPVQFKHTHLEATLERIG